MLSDGCFTIKSVPPTRESTAAPQARPLSALTREDLGAAWARALARARSDGELRSARGTAAWLRRPDVVELLDEFRDRAMTRVAEVHFWAEVCLALDVQ